ncbi:phosphate transport system permease protein PstC [archaeon BMS3Abin16]|nr:phosphate transport system permease protein PstC [archaeon BMS3Abin16]GBE56137.1 phosphate transport system permease protein PstC [archaeon BMS3Bbin16]
MKKLKEMVIEKILLASALISILTMIGIIAVLSVETINFFRQVTFTEFFTDTRWAPLFEPQHFGILPLINGTLIITVGAAIVAIPLGLLSAIYLSEYADFRIRQVVKPVLEILAGIPTVVYGYFALTFITPMLRRVYPETNIFNAASASIVVGILILPMVASLSEDAIRSVPRSIKEGAYALGATPFEVSTKIVVPAALSGILASFMLALSRAIGETMAVTIAAGGMPNLTLNPLESVQTMTAYIVQVSLGDTPYGTIEYQSIFAVGMVLFIMTLGMNITSQIVRRRFREVYQ